MARWASWKLGTSTKTCRPGCVGIRDPLDLLIRGKNALQTVAQPDFADQRLRGERCHVLPPDVRVRTALVWNMVNKAFQSMTSAAGQELIWRDRLVCQV